MPESWLSTSAIVIAVLAVLGLLWKAAHWKGSIDSDLPYLKSIIDEIRNDIEKILQALQVPTAVGKSPIQLTDLGRQIATQVQVREWAAREAKSIPDDRTPADLPAFEINAFCESYVNMRSRE